MTSWYPDNTVLNTTSPVATPLDGSAPMASPSNTSPSASTRAASGRCRRFRCGSRVDSLNGGPRRRPRPAHRREWCGGPAPAGFALVGGVAAPAGHRRTGHRPGLVGVDHTEVRRSTGHHRHPVPVRRCRRWPPGAMRAGPAPREGPVPTRRGPGQRPSPGPAFPEGPRSKGISLACGACGAWSVATASMVPSARPARMAATSASVRSGGWTLNTGS